MRNCDATDPPGATRRGVRPAIAAAAFALSLVLAPVTRGAGEVVEKHDDGSVKARYRTDADGRRNGSYQELFPGGRVRVKGTYAGGKKTGTWLTYDERGNTVESASYKDDLLDGPYARNYPTGRPRLKTRYRRGDVAAPVSLYDAKGKTVRQVTYPRPRSVVEKGYASLFPTDGGKVKYREEPKLDPPYKAGALEQSSLDEALKLTKLYRFLSGVPYEGLKLDPTSTDKAQHAAVLLHRLGRLTHAPERPTDMADSFFKVAAAGCAESNLHSGHDSLIPAIHGLMDDSDDRNVEHVGHRQWVLSPGMTAVGFGHAGGYTAMHVVDPNSRRGQDFNFIAFPGEGFYPRSLIQPHYAWSVHLNGDKVRVGEAGTVKVRVTRLNEYYEDDGDVPAELVAVAKGRGANASVIIFEPRLESVEPGRLWVEVRGLKNAKGVEALLTYVVDFVDLPTPSQASPAAGAG